MSILFSIDVCRLRSNENDVSALFSGCDIYERADNRHSRLASSGADAMLATLVRIHRRQVRSGSTASGWDPLAVWHTMLRDCCERVSEDN